MNDNVVIVKSKDGTEFLQFKRLLEFPNLRHCYTLRYNDINIKSNTNKLEEDNELIKSYKKVAKALEFNWKNIVKPHQFHTDNIEKVENLNQEFDEVDGVMTNKKNIFLCTTSADCTSLLFYDDNKKVIADVHSGWRGTLQQIGKKAVEKLTQEYGCNPKDIICCIGPCIKKCHFEVDENVMELFKKKFEYTGEIEKIIEKGKTINKIQKYNIDTTLINEIILKETGLLEKNIIDSGICTVCNSNMFHSYRADKEKSGRNGAFIGMI